MYIKIAIIFRLMTFAMAKIKKVSAETKAAIRRKSAYTLPNNPTDSGYKADDIRRAFWQPIADISQSAIAVNGEAAQRGLIFFEEFFGNGEGCIALERTFFYRVSLCNENGRKVYESPTCNRLNGIFIPLKENFRR